MEIGPDFPAVLEAARAGEEWAWRDLYGALAPGLLGYLRLRSDHPEDLCGEIFCDLVRDLPRFEGDERAFHAWVFLIARHRLIDDRRRMSRRPQSSGSTAFPPEEIAPDDVEREVLGRIATEEIKKVLERLVPDQRDVLLLRIVVGLSVDEVARVLGKRPGAIRALQHRAIKGLRKTLDPRNATDAIDG